jgi:hypothetical protein
MRKSKNSSADTLRVLPFTKVLLTKDLIPQNIPLGLVAGIATPELLM